MSDLFQDGVPDKYIESVISVMKLAKWHTFQVLTKRSVRMRDFLNGPRFDRTGAAHIWWGVSVEDREYGVPRIEHLRATDARIRFLSIEPLLMDVGRLDLDGIGWVIVGGESGPGARQMSKEWVESIRRQCEDAGVPFFSSSGVDFRNPRKGVTLTAGPTTTCRLGLSLRFLTGPNAGDSLKFGVQRFSIGKKSPLNEPAVVGDDGRLWEAMKLIIATFSAYHPTGRGSSLRSS